MDAKVTCASWPGRTYFNKIQMGLRLLMDVRKRPRGLAVNLGKKSKYFPPNLRLYCKMYKH